MLKTMMRIASIFALGSMLSVAAADVVADQSVNVQGPYIGGQLGYANENYSRNQYNPPLSATSVDSKGFAGRLYAGYDINQYFAAELGYSYLPQVKYKNVAGSNNNVTFHQQMVDLTAKGTAPLNDQFAVYGKAGAAYVHRGSFDYKQSGVNFSQAALTKVVPTVGAGVKYNITPHTFADVSYSYYFKSGDLPATNFYGVGLGYKF
jgi:opacity protein-like surface antigen